MQGVIPLSRVELADPAPPPKLCVHPKRKARHAYREEHRIEHWWQYAAETHQPVERVHAGANLFYVHPSVSGHKLSQLRQGNFTTRCIIDLHGLSETQASEVLAQWMARCRLRSDRFALIIHGKGFGSDQQEPVLKNFINWWLRNHARVLAFCSAQEADGGTGAVYVLLGGIEGSH